MAKLSEFKQCVTAGTLARLYPRLVGLLRPGRGTSQRVWTGGVDSAPHPQMLLGTLARLSRTGTSLAAIDPSEVVAANRQKLQRSVAHRTERSVTHGPQQRRFTTLWVSDAVRPCGCHVEGRRVQPPDAENRTSGGVGGVAGAIPPPRPDHSFIRASSVARVGSSSCSRIATKD